MPAGPPATRSTSIPPLADVVLARIEMFKHGRSTESALLVPGRALGGTEPLGRQAVEHPSIADAGTGFFDAVRAAAAESRRSPVRNGFVSGWQPVAVVQARDGSFAITPLLVHTGHRSVAMPTSLPAGFRSTIERSDAALQAIVSADRWVDMREVRVGDVVDGSRARSLPGTR